MLYQYIQFYAWMENVVLSKLPIYHQVQYIYFCGIINSAYFCNKSSLFTINRNIKNGLYKKYELN